MMAGRQAPDRFTLIVLVSFLAGCASPRTCFYPLDIGLKDQYLVLFSRDIVARADDPRDIAERNRLYAERLDSYFETLPGVETCRTQSFSSYEGGGIGARVECPLSPPLKVRPGIYTQNGSPAYMACYPST